MSYLLDTSVLGRLANLADPGFAVATDAVLELHRQGEVLHITGQNLIEFRNFATWPLSINGLGMSIPDTEFQSAKFESAFPLLPDRPDIFIAWKLLVQASGAIGKQVHDARLVAVCHAHGVTHLLTFNTTHFARFASVAPCIVVVDPATV